MYIFQHKGQVFGPMALSQEIDVRLLDIWRDDIGVMPSVLVCEHEATCRGFDHVPTFYKYVDNWYKRNLNERNILAINIKEDGLALPLKEAIEETGLPYDRFFCFDMAIKEVQQYKKAGLPIATSVSSYGVDYPCGDSLLFDWFPELPVSYDALYHYCYAGNLYDTLFLGDEKFVAISPELHDSDFNGKELRKFWKWCEEKGFYGLITDYPEKAEVFFNGNEADSR